MNGLFHNLPNDGKSQHQTVLRANRDCVLVAKAPNRSHSSAFICQRYHLGSQHGTMSGIS